MVRVQLTKNLYLDEYISKDLYVKYLNVGKLNQLVWRLDKELVLSDQKLREIFGPVTINNWFNGGDRLWSGLRTPDSPYYSPDSSHSSGHASDKIFTNATSEEVQEYIKKNWKQLGITELELVKGWTHSGTRFVIGQTELYAFKP